MLLAIEGGPKTREKPFRTWPQFTDSQIEKVTSVLTSGKVNYWTGNECKQFEAEYASYLDKKHTISLANGTLALDAALLGYGVGEGDEVICTPRSFVASASVAMLRGAIPVFVDVDLDSQNITAETIASGWTEKTKAIIVVHLSGYPADVASIMRLIQSDPKWRDVKVIEDCAQAHGARYRDLEGNDKPVGSIGHVSVFSFCQDKIFTTAGEGGLLATDDSSLWKKIWSYKDHGKEYDLLFPSSQTSHNSLTASATSSGYRYLHSGIGTNWRMTEVQAAIGRIALRDLLEEYVKTRRRHANYLNNRLSKIHAIRLPNIDDAFEDILNEGKEGQDISSKSRYRHSYYKYYCFVRPERLNSGWDRNRIMGAISAEGVPCYTGAGELYLEGVFNSTNSRIALPAATVSTPSGPPTYLPGSRNLTETSLMFLVHPTLTIDEEMEDTCLAVEKVMKQASLTIE